MVTHIPNVQNWTVTPQNGQAGYFTLMNTWLGQSTLVIASLQTAIAAQNIANNQINELAIKAENSAIIASGLAQFKGVWSGIVIYGKGESVESTMGSKIYYTSKVDNNLNHSVADTNYWLYNPINDKLDKDFSLLTDKTTPIDTDILAIRETGGLLKKISWVNIKATLLNLFVAKDANGNVGINNNAPLTKLHVGGSITAGDTTYSGVSAFIGAILNNNGDTPSLDIRRWGGGGTTHGVVKIAGNGLGEMLFYTDVKSTNTEATTEVMKIDASGNLLLGRSGGTGIIQASAIYSWNNDSNYTYIINQTVSGTAQVFGANVGGDLKAAILSNGTYQSATNVYGSTSDAKLKENIVDTSPKLDKLMQVQVRNFNYIGQEYSKQIGVIAQEIEQIFPSVVFETKDTKQVEVTKERIIPALEELKDDDGNITQEAKPEIIEEYTETETVETGETTKNVKYSVIYMMMLKGMQEMREEYTAEIKSLKDELAVLKGAK